MRTGGFAAPHSAAAKLRMDMSRAARIAVDGLRCRRRRRLHFELRHHVVILVRSVVTMEQEPAGEIPELVDEPNRLIRSHPDRILESFELARTRRATCDLDDLEAAKMDVHRVSPAAGFVHQHPFLVRIDDWPRVDACRIPLQTVDRPVPS